MEILLKKDWNYTLIQEGLELRLSVLAGTVGIYEINLALNDEEKGEFEKSGETYIDELANQFSSNSEKFAGRI